MLIYLTHTTYHAQSSHFNAQMTTSKSAHSILMCLPLLLTSTSSSMFSCFAIFSACHRMDLFLHEPPPKATPMLPSGGPSRLRAQSLDQLLVEVREEEEDEEEEDSECANISSASAAPALLDGSTNLSPSISPIDTFRRRPGGRLKTLFFGRRRQSVAVAYGASAALHASLPAASVAEGRLCSYAHILMPTVTFPIPTVALSVPTVGSFGTFGHENDSFGH